jgi:hypothetical protein
MIAQDLKTSELLADGFWGDDVLPELLKMLETHIDKVEPEATADHFMKKLLASGRSDEERRQVIFGLAMEGMVRKVNEALKFAAIDLLMTTLAVDEMGTGVKK